MGKDPIRTALEQRKEGKKLLDALNKCKTGKEVLEFLYHNMKPADITDRAKNVQNIPELRKYDATWGEIRMAYGNHRHQDIMNAAANRYCDLEKTSTKSFKDAMEKYIKQAMEKDIKEAKKKQQYVSTILLSRRIRA